MNRIAIAKELLKLAKELTAEREWWQAVFGFGNIFFQAASASHAAAIAKKWGAKAGMGTPDKVKKTEKPKALDQRGAFERDGELDVYVEQ